MNPNEEDDGDATLRARWLDNAIEARARRPLPHGAVRESEAHLTDEQAERFQEGLQSLLADVEALVERAGQRKARHSAQIRSDLRDAARHARWTVAGLDGSTGVHARSLGMAVHDYVRHEPWRSAAAAAGTGLALGVVIGLLLRRR